MCLRLLKTHYVRKDKMVIKNSEFIKSAFKKSEYPETSYPETALAGRSNVGKSSFINKLLNRKNLARVGKTQGKTRLVNFFKVNNEFVLVDLPGYGFANVSKEMKASWGKMIEDYLNTRKQLKNVVLLLDIRHDPTEDDMIMLDYIEARGFTPFVVLTKADKLAKTKIEPRADEFREMLGLENVFAFSSLNGYGREAILEKIFTGGQND